MSIATRISWIIERNLRMPIIPAQWARFMPRVPEIEDIADPIPWGVSRGVDDEGRLDYCSTVRVRDMKGSVPNGMMRVSVPPRAYAVFRHAGHVSRLGETYDAIWTRWLPSSGEQIAAPRAWSAIARGLTRGRVKAAWMCGCPWWGDFWQLKAIPSLLHQNFLNQT